MEHTILVVEDDAPQLRALTGFLKKQLFRVFWSSSGMGGIRIAQKEPIDVVWYKGLSVV